MRGIINVVTAVVILVASASASYAANETLRCDKVKTAAVAKMFKDSLRCSHKGFFDNSFDVTTCRGNAYDRCTANIQKADDNFGAACFQTGNFNVCDDALDAALDIYDDI